jgi:hypothetical protein
MVEPSTHNPTFVDSNPAADIGRERMAKLWAVEVFLKGK